jgi:type I restriction enzyme R subunit
MNADPDWDGPPIQVYEVPEGGEDVTPPDPTPAEEPITDEIDVILADPNRVIDDAGLEDDDRHVYVVSGVTFTVIAERVQYYDRGGKLITESLKDYTRRTVQEEFATLDEFLKRWKSTDRKQAIVDELLERGVLLEALEDAIAGDLDPFDLICHVAFDQPALTRRERADNVRKRDVFTKYGDQAREVLGGFLKRRDVWVVRTGSGSRDGLGGNPSRPGMIGAIP